MRDGSLNGSRRRNRSLTKLKIVVFSPMPSASVKTAIAVNAGDLRSWRKANFKSFISLGTKCLNRVDTSGAARRNKTGGSCNDREQPGDGEIDGRIEWIHFEENIFQGGRHDDSQQQGSPTRSERKSDHQLPRALLHHHSENSCRVCAQRHPDAKLLRALIHGETHHAVKTDGRKHECYCAKNNEQVGHDSVAAEGFIVQTRRCAGKIDG